MLKSENLKNLEDDVDINIAWETIRESINISDEESLCYYELKKHSHGSMKDAQNYQTKGIKPNCSDCRIQAK
jgi:hypothetical protein